nr:MAG TPA: hypothetical protein [Bacteriophage sp.]
MMRIQKLMNIKTYSIHIRIKMVNIRLEQESCLN